MTTAGTPQLNSEDLELLSSYIDGQLTPDERAALDRRLEAEPALRVALGELRATVTVLRELPPARPPRSFTIDPAQVAPRRATFWSWARIVQLAGPIAAVLVVAVVTLSALRGGLGGGAPAAMEASAPAPAAMEASAPTAAPEVAALEAPAAPMSAPAGDVAREAAPSPAPTMAAAAESGMAAVTAAPAATEAPLAASAPAAATANEPTAAVGAYADGVIPLSDADPTQLAQAADAQVATPAISSPGTAVLATPAPEVKAAPAAPAVPLLVVIPLALLIVGAGAYLALRRRP